MLPDIAKARGPFLCDIPGEWTNTIILVCCGIVNRAIYLHFVGALYLVSFKCVVSLEIIRMHSIMVLSYNSLHR